MSESDKKYMDIIEKSIKEIKYGTVTIIIQDGIVMQIDKTDKIRIKS